MGGNKSPLNTESTSMKCADPVLCYTNTEGKKLFRNFSFIKKHTLILQNAQQIFDCGKCLFCRKKRAYELAARCVLHASMYKENCFITLTYDEKKKGYHNEFQYSDIQKFKKRIRAYFRRTFNRRIYIFNVHEYGKNGKKHWHLIMFNAAFSDQEIHSQVSTGSLYTSKTLSALWTHGFHTIGDVSEASAMYTAQYMEKDFKNSNTGTKRKSHSIHSGLGKAYFEKHYKQLLTLGYVPFNGKKLPLPRYYEKLAHKHWCHFHMQSAFYDTNTRKALYRPFSGNYPPSEDISRLWSMYSLSKKERTKELEKEWQTVISHYLTTNEEPDFIKACNNALYDLRNKQNEEKF